VGKVLSREEIKERRKYFLTQAEKKTKIQKGDRRVYGSRMCAICGTQLSRMISTTGGGIATKHHYHCYFSDIFFVNVCMDSRSCYSNISKLEVKGGHY